jgi:DnaJ-class molecular chaperone
MDIPMCRKILEVDQTASIADINQAYKDIINVWHPDRFTHNPRLQRKAEAKIKEVNIAYETLKTFYARKQVSDKGQNGSHKEKDEGTRRSSRGKETGNRTEIVFELGTQLILSTWSYLSSRLRRMVETQVIDREEERRTRGRGEKQKHP